tara:strand:+ start:1225 stop:1431 length:207 start_codon:yes stop_codon:yes gene_type:complete
MEPNRGKLKVLVMALKEIVEELESEVYSDPDQYAKTTEAVEAVATAFSAVDPNQTYDEAFSDDDGYPD